MPVSLSKFSIRTWLLILVLVGWIPLGAVLVNHFLVTEADAARASAISLAREVTHATASSLEMTLRDHESMMRLISMEFRGAPPQRSSRFLPDQFMEIHPQVMNLAAHDLQVNNVYSYLPNPTPAALAKTFPWVQRALKEDGFFASDAFKGRLSGRWAAIYTFPTYDDAGHRSGFVSASIDLQKLNRQIFRSVPDSVSVAVLDNKGQFLLRSTHPEQWIGQPGPLGMAQVNTSQTEGTVRIKSVEGVEKLVAFVTIPSTGWRVVSGVPEELAMSGYVQTRNRTLAIGAFLVATILAVAWSIAAAISIPIRSLAAVAKKIADGDRSVRVDPSGPSEIQAVARQFNEMLNAQSDSLQKLSASEARWKFALEGAGDGVWDWDLRLEYIYYSPHYLKMLGYSEGEWESTTEAWADHVHPADYPRALAINRDYRAGNTKGSFSTEYRMRCKDGTYKWILARGLIVERDGDGNPSRMVGTNTDISKTKQLESDLRIAAIAFQSQLPMFILDSNCHFIQINRAFAKLTGYTSHEILGKSPEILASAFAPGGSDPISLWQRLSQAGEASDEVVAQCKDGSVVSTLATLTAVKNEAFETYGYVGTLTDIAERKRMQEERIAQELKQRNALVREVHHRVKNNLQGMIGLLQEYGRNHPETISPIAQIVGQVQSIAVIHGLQGRAHENEVRVCELTSAIAANIASLWNTPVTVDIPVPWVPRVILQSEAVPVALVLNELILNAVKHGGQRKGSVHVAVEDHHQPSSVQIRITNSGVWAPSINNASVGLSLVDTLLPRHGATLSRTVEHDMVVTKLVLTQPVVSSEETRDS